MKRTLLLSLLVAAAVLGACSRDELVPEESQPEQARLKSISVTVTTLVLPEGGTVTVPFSVKDPGFVFDQVRLQDTRGESPQWFTLKGFSKGEGAGIYEATLSDNGSGEIYAQEVCLAIATGPDSFVQSAFFTVRSQAADRPGMVRTGLPVVFVDTQNGQGVYSKTEYVTATLSIAGNATYPGLQDVPCSIRGRGNTTWTWPKKPYLLKLDEKEHVLGMHKHKRWVLLANFMDRTLMRNLVSMHVASLTSLAWTPGCVPVELVLNGKHLGSYLLIEQVRVDNHRVAITEMTDQDNSGEAVTGGYLLELDFHYDNEFQWKDHNIPFAVKYPDPEDLTSAQKTYIKNYIAQVSNAIYGADFADPQKGYAQFLDVDSFVDEWIVYEVMCNHELGNPGSVYLHKDRSGKLVAGPVWDFDWGVLSFYTSNGANDLVNGRAIWYERLFQDPAFKAKVKARFQELLPQLETIPDYMDACEGLLEKSAQLNFAMWNPADDRSQNGGKIINGDENLSFHSAIQRLKENYTHHLGIIGKKL